MFTKLLLFLVSTLVLRASAHTIISNVAINTTTFGLGQCIRPYAVSDRTFPVMDPSSDDMRCRTTSMDSKDTAMCDIQAGTNITIEFHKGGVIGTVISASHKGPCLVYMSPMEANGMGPVWFKIYEDGYDKDKDLWCTNKLIANDGKLFVNIPEDIKPGAYLLRAELIALHNARSAYTAANPSSGAQYYLNCVQLQVYGTGSVVPDGVEIPGAYKPDEPGIVFDVYKKPIDSYPIPGPAVYLAGSKLLIPSSSPKPTVSVELDTEPLSQSSMPSSLCKGRLRKRKNVSQF